MHRIPGDDDHHIHPGAPQPGVEVVVHLRNTVLLGEEGAATRLNALRLVGMMIVWLTAALIIHPLHPFEYSPLR
jgi:hypothetical protein